MLSARHGIAALAAVLASVALSATAEATYRGCGFDRYGYHPPDFRGCARSSKSSSCVRPSSAVRLRSE